MRAIYLVCMLLVGSVVVSVAEETTDGAEKEKCDAPTTATTAAVDDTAAAIDATEVPILDLPDLSDEGPVGEESSKVLRGYKAKSPSELFAFNTCSDSCESMTPKFARDMLKKECRGTAEKVSDLLNIVDAMVHPAATEPEEELKRFVRRVFVQLNGENEGYWFSYQPGCSGDLARAATRAHGKTGWDMKQGKRLYTVGGCPITDMDRSQWGDILCSDRVLHLLLHEETWVWPGVKIGHTWQVDGATFTTKSLAPKVIFVEHAITDEHADELVMLAKPRFRASGEQHYSPGFENYRTSESAHFGQETVAYETRKRAYQLARLPKIEYAEEIQVVKYEEGQWYKQHQDYFHGWKFPNGKKPKKKTIVPNRHVTLFLYANDDFQGGETVFPFAEPVKGQAEVTPSAMNECSRGLVVKPVKGGGALFYSKKGHGRTDRTSMHGGCPPHNGGVKYGVNCFMWDNDYVESFQQWSHILG